MATEIKKIPRNPDWHGFFRIDNDVIYSTATGKDLKADIIYPWNAGNDAIKADPLPLIVFVQGSGWQTPDRNFEIPQLCELARKGYVVATCGHRDMTKDAQPPAFLKDIKCAIRFFRKNAAKYGIDPERVAIWGTSSGGNTAQLVGLTGDLPVFETKEHAGYSDAVRAVVSCFGPSDMNVTFRFFQDRNDDDMTAYIESGFGKDHGKWKELFDLCSPVSYVEDSSPFVNGPRAAVPPILLLHGSGDTIVLYDEMTEMLAKLDAAGKYAEAYEIEDADHESDFWSQQVLDIIADFLKRNI